MRLYGYAQSAEQIYNRYLESKDGASSSSLFIPAGVAVDGDSLACQVVPSDSWSDGAARTSPSITIGAPATQYTRIR